MRNRLRGVDWFNVGTASFLVVLFVGSAALVGCAIATDPALDDDQEPAAVELVDDDDDCDAGDQRERDRDCGYYDAGGAWIWYSWVILGSSSHPPVGVRPAPPAGARPYPVRPATAPKPATGTAPRPATGTAPRPAAPAPRPVAPPPAPRPAPPAPAPARR